MPKNQSNVSKTRVAFLGGKPLGVRCLQTLLDNPRVDLVAVVCRPREASGWWHSEGQKRVIDVVEEFDLNRVEEGDLLNLDVDVAFSVMFYNIVRRSLIDHCGGRIYNLHPAPLPYYRGSNSYSHAIINGESEYGVTLHVIDPGIDTGAIMEVKWFDIDPHMSAKALHDYSREKAVELFEERLPDILDGEFQLADQKELLESTGKVSHTYQKTSLEKLKRIATEDIQEKPAETLRLIRGLDFPPFEPGYVLIEGEKVYLSINPCDNSR